MRLSKCEQDRNPDFSEIAPRAPFQPAVLLFFLFVLGFSYLPICPLLFPVYHYVTPMFYLVKFDLSLCSFSPI